MHSKDKLAAALREVDLPEMADKAAEGYYHDFLSPLDLPELALVGALGAVAKNHPKMAEILLLRGRVIDGEFDATKEESDAWAKSPEGQEAFRKLVRGTK